MSQFFDYIGNCWVASLWWRLFFDTVMKLPKITASCKFSNFEVNVRTARIIINKYITNTIIKCTGLYQVTKVYELSCEIHTIRTIAFSLNYEILYGLWSWIYAQNPQTFPNTENQIELCRYWPLVLRISNSGSTQQTCPNCSKIGLREFNGNLSQIETSTDIYMNACL